MITLNVATITTTVLANYIRRLASEYLDECNTIEDLEFFMSYQKDDSDDFYRSLFNFVRREYNSDTSFELESEEDLNRIVKQMDLLLLEDYEDEYKIAIDDLSDERKALEQAFEEIKEC